jgi:hypothetical protein
VFFDVGTRCIPIGCEGPILRSGMFDTEAVGSYLVCVLPSGLCSPIQFLKPALGPVGSVRRFWVSLYFFRFGFISTIRSPDANHSFLSFFFAAFFVHLNQSFLVALISGDGSSCSASLAALSTH